jgi:hypothetical protein
MSKRPEFLGDVYRDLRDRHLLLPAVALLVALVAVPLLLSKSAEPSPPPAGAVAGGGAEPTSPAVLTEDVSVRDYRRRLDRMASKNPFKQQFRNVARSGQLEGVSSSASLGGTTSGTANLGGGSSLSGSTASATTSPPSSPTPSGSTSGSGGSSPTGSGSSGQQREPETRVFTYRIDVKVGEAGAVERRDDVRRLVPLPGAGAPVITFLGVDETGKRALFAVSPDVTAVDTDGRCAPSPATCQYLILRAGENASLDYSVDGKTYRLWLLNIHASRVKGASAPDLKTTTP